MDVDQVVACWEADEKRVRARLSAPDAAPKVQVFGLSGMQMLEAIFSGELPPCVAAMPAKSKAYWGFPPVA